VKYVLDTNVVARLLDNDARVAFRFAAALRTALVCRSPTNEEPTDDEDSTDDGWLACVVATRPHRWTRASGAVAPS